MSVPTETHGERIRLLMEALGEQNGYLLVRRLLRQRQRQKELTFDKTMSQSTASTRLRELRLLGIVEAGQDDILRIAHRGETLAVLAAVARLSEAIEQASRRELKALERDTHTAERLGDWKPRGT